MDINKNIESINGYFLSFNIAEGMSYVLAKFPKTWKIQDFSKDGIEVSFDGDTGGYYFFTEMSKGVDILFDSIRSVITMNKEIEEKTQLFSIKLNELKELFSEKSLEDLKQLRFVCEESFGDIYPTNLPKQVEQPVEVDTANNTAIEETNIVQLNTDEATLPSNGNAQFFKKNKKK